VKRNFDFPSLFAAVNRCATQSRCKAKFLRSLLRIHHAWLCAAMAWKHRWHTLWLSKLSIPFDGREIGCLDAGKSFLWRKPSLAEEISSTALKREKGERWSGRRRTPTIVTLQELPYEKTMYEGPVYPGTLTC